ncbi:MAG TPA: DUF2306 domain-containing protein [Bacteroidia bacterium]|jgi:hypothetical protein|nr:DUF2306 domain-containing protein [Bacteroidia bacterium]
MNSRVLTAKKVLGNSFLFLFWTPVIVLSLLLIYNTLPYFTFNRHLNFLEERSVLYDKPVWRISFYVHIAAGALCIATALLQFSSWILRKRKRIHIISGKIYVFVVLLIGAPSGFYMTFFAKGGFAERACFMFMAVFWFYATYKGFAAAARERNFLSHKFWMIRSYAMALTAVTFRVYHILFYLGGMSDLTNYSVSLWISVLGNAAIAEAIIFFNSRNYLTTLTT